MKQILKGDKATIITRSDLSKGLQVVQSAHAIANFAIEHNDVFVAWQKGSNYLVCLSVETREELVHLAERLKLFDIKLTEFREPDVNNELTAICVQSLPKKMHTKIFKSLKLTCNE